MRRAVPGSLRRAPSFTSRECRCQMLVGPRYILARFRAMNRPRFTPSPPVSSPSRALSGWRARLASDPIPRLLREGSPSVLARIRRDLIDDSEAPGLDEVWAYPEVKALVKKMREERQLRAQGAGQGAGRAEVRRGAGDLARARSPGRPGRARWSEGGQVPAPSCTKSGRLPAGVAGDRRRHRRPGPGRDAQGPGQDGGAALSGLGHVGAVPAGLRERRAGGEGPAVPARAPAGRRRLGLARGAHRFGGAALQPPGDRHGAARLRLVGGPARLARGAAGGRAAGHPLPAARPLPRPQGARATGRC